MFAIVAVNFEAFQDLPPPEFKLMVALTRYANRAGGCCPSLSQLARDVLGSAPTVSRYLDKLEARGCFARQRRAGGRYFYVLAERFRPGWPERRDSAEDREAVIQSGFCPDASGREPQPIDIAAAAAKRPQAIAPIEKAIAAVEGGVSQRETQEAFLAKHSEEVRESARASSLSADEIPNGWEEAATTERRRVDLPDVDLRVEWRKLAIYDGGAQISRSRWLMWAMRARLDHTNTPIGGDATAVANPETLPNAAPAAGTDQERARARGWARTGRWAPQGVDWGPAPDRPGCALPAGLVAWCLRERQERAA